MLKYFLVKGGLSDILSTNTIISGEKIHYKRHLVIKNGHYFQGNWYEELKKIEVPQTKGAISLGPSENKQGRFRFMSLNLAKKIARRSWDTISMTYTVISRNNNLACSELNQFIFTD